MITLVYKKMMLCVEVYVKMSKIALMTLIPLIKGLFFSLVTITIIENITSYFIHRKFDSVACDLIMS